MIMGLGAPKEYLFPRWPNQNFAHTLYIQVNDTFPVNFIVGIISLSHWNAFFEAMKTIWLVWMLPAKVKVPSNLVGEVL